MMMDDHIIAQTGWIIRTGWNNTAHIGTRVSGDTLTSIQCNGMSGHIPFNCLDKQSHAKEHMMRTVSHVKPWGLLAVLLTVVLCLMMIPHAHAVEPSGTPTPEITAERTQFGVSVTVSHARFEQQSNGDVAIVSDSGELLDVLSTTYDGKPMEYRMYGTNRLLARRGKGAPQIVTGQNSAFRGFDWGGYTRCIAKTSLGGGVTGAIATAFSGTGAALGAATGMIGGLVWGPFDCYKR